MLAVETEAVSAARTPQSEYSPTRIQSSSSLTRLGRVPAISRASQVYRSILYAAMVFISFFLMLVFMTYNVRNNAQKNGGIWSLIAVTGVFDPFNRRWSRHRALPIFRVWLGSRG